MLLNVIAILTTSYSLLNSIKEEKRGLTIWWIVLLSILLICLGINLTEL